MCPAGNLGTLAAGTPEVRISRHRQMTAVVTSVPAFCAIAWTHQLEFRTVHAIGTAHRNRPFEPMRPCLHAKHIRVGVCDFHPVPPSRTRNAEIVLRHCWNAPKQPWYFRSILNAIQIDSADASPIVRHPLRHTGNRPAREFANLCPYRKAKKLCRRTPFAVRISGRDRHEVSSVKLRKGRS